MCVPGSNMPGKTAAKKTPQVQIAALVKEADLCTNMEKLLICLFCCVLICSGIQAKISKAMKNILIVKEDLYAEKERLQSERDAKEENDQNKKYIEVKPFQELRSIFHPEYYSIHKESHNQHPPLQCSSTGHQWVSLTQMIKGQ